MTSGTTTDLYAIWGSSGTNVFAVGGDGTILHNSDSPGAFNKANPANEVTEQYNDLSLTWGTSSGASSYEYCFDTTNNNNCDGIWTTTGTNTQVKLSGLTGGTTYYWQVRARNIAGTSEANEGIWWSFTCKFNLLYLPMILK
jgi:hypothetical protein